MKLRRHLQQMKENDGKAARNATMRVILWLAGAQAFLVLLYVLFRVEEGPAHVGHMRVGSSGHNMQLGSNNNNPHERAVIEAKYFLIDVRLTPSAVAYNDKHPSYHGVTGVFCPLDWHLHKSNPSTVAMFRDLVTQSTHCQQHRIELDLRTVAQQARHHDRHSVTHAVHSLQLSGLVFHETRTGSTLVANLLVGADPLEHRVYSEASPLLAAMDIASSKNCDEHKAHDLIQDVLYIMGRSSDPRETRVFYKIQSVGVRYMATLMDALQPQPPPWIFVYRDSLEVMMSHMKDGKTGGVCLRGRTRPHSLVREVALSQNRKVESLTKVEYCAAHLASLCEAALRQGSGRFVNYKTLPDIMWESVLPDTFHVHPSHTSIEKMKQVAAVYSKGRGTKANQEWQEDSAQKQAKASEEIRLAALTFLEPSFDKMEALAQEQS